MDVLSSSTLSLSENIALLFSKVSLYQTLKMIVEENEILKRQQYGYLLHLFKEESRILGQSEQQQQKSWISLQRIHERKLSAINQFLKIYPALLTMDKEDMLFLSNIPSSTFSIKEIDDNKQI